MERNREEMNLSKITAKDANYVLWYFSEGGWEPSDFIEGVLQSFERADAESYSRLAVVFPGLAEALEVVNTDENWIERLREIGERIG